MILGILSVKCYNGVLCACGILNIIFALTNVNSCPTTPCAPKSHATTVLSSVHQTGHLTWCLVHCHFFPEGWTFGDFVREVTEQAIQCIARAPPYFF